MNREQVDLINVEELSKVIYDRLLSDNIDAQNFKNNKLEWDAYHDFEELKKYREPQFYKDINL